MRPPTPNETMPTEPTPTHPETHAAAPNWRFARTAVTPVATDAELAAAAQLLTFAGADRERFALLTGAASTILERILLGGATDDVRERMRAWLVALDARRAHVWRARTPQLGSLRDELGAKCDQGIGWFLAGEECAACGLGRRGCEAAGFAECRGERAEPIPEAALV